MKNYTAKLIGESSGGFTGVEIYNSRNNLIYSHDFLSNGSTYQGYINALCEAVDTMLDCADCAEFDGNDKVLLDCESTTGILVEYNTKTGWKLRDHRGFGQQSSEIVDALMLCELVEKDSDHEENADSEIVEKIAEHIKSRLK